MFITNPINKKKLLPEASQLYSKYLKGQRDVIDIIKEYHPDLVNATKTRIFASQLTIRDMKDVVARKSGFVSWSRLEEYFTWDLSVISQDTKALTFLLEENPNRANQRVIRFRRNGSQWKMVPAHFANNNSRMLGLLLTYGADINVPGESCLAENSSPKYIDFSLSRGEHLENQFYNGSVLSLSAYQGEINTLKHYIRRGALVNARSERPPSHPWQGFNTGETPLHKACYCSSRLRGLESAQIRISTFGKTVLALLLGGANPNIKTNQNVPSDMGPDLVVYGETPLHFAAASGATELVEMLLGYGALKSERTANGLTPKDYAARNGHTHICEILKDTQVGVKHFLG